MLWALHHALPLVLHVQVVTFDYGYFDCCVLHSFHLGYYPIS